MPKRVSQFTEDFNRADAADIGANWDAGYTGESALAIVGNRIRASAVATSALETVNAVSLTANQYAQITLSTFTGAVLAIAGVRVRNANAATNTGYAFQALRNEGTKTSQIVRVDAGAGTVLITENATTWAATDVLRGEVYGTALRLYRNGVLLLSFTDANLTSGKAGINLYVDTGGSLADLEVDDFIAGDLVGIEFVNTIAATIGTAASTWSIATHSSKAGGAAFIVGVGVGSSAVTVSTMADNTTNVYLRAIVAATPRPVAGAELWYTRNISSASTRVSVTLSGSASGSIAVGQFTHLSTANTLDVVGERTSTAANSSLYGSSQVTPTSTDGLIVSFTRLTASTIGTITNLSTMTTWVSTQSTGVVRTHGMYGYTVDAASTWTGSFKSSSKAVHASVIAVFNDTFVAAVGGGGFQWAFSMMGVQ